MGAANKPVGNPQDWNIYGDSVGGWFAWNGRTRKRIDLFPIPQGGTWRDSLWFMTQGPYARNAFSVAVQQFERLIGPYYESRPGARR